MTTGRRQKSSQRGGEQRSRQPLPVRWTSRAREDLLGIGDYIAEERPAAAETLLNQLIKVAEGLGRFPRRGRVVPEFEAEHIRETIVRRYRVVYRVNEDEIWIVTIFDSRREFPSDVEPAEEPMKH